MAHITIEQALEEIKQGKMVILADGKDPENEGDFCLAAELVTPEAVNFMAKHGRGLICVPMKRTPCNAERAPGGRNSVRLANSGAPCGTITCHSQRGCNSTSSTAMPTAADTGLPPKVLK